MKNAQSLQANPSRDYIVSGKDTVGADDKKERKTKRQHQLTKKFTMALALIALIQLTACEPSKPKEQSSQHAPTIYTTFYPTTYFVERIAGENVDVVNPCPRDADPAFWMPDDATVAKYQQADLIILNGASFEKWTAKVTLPESRAINTTKPFKDEYITVKNSVTHSHGPGGKHTHAGIDGHTWLDPINAKRQAEAIRDALANNWPAHADAFKKNYDALADDLDKLDARLKEISPKLGMRVLFCSHPAYNYLARRYSWQVVNFHLDPEEMPNADTLAEIKQAKSQDSAGLMLWESEPLPEIAELLKKEHGLTGVAYSPSESLDDPQEAAGEDFLTIMNANVDRLSKALTE